MNAVVIAHVRKTRTFISAKVSLENAANDEHIVLRGLVIRHVTR
jgi:hypothetical protein